MNFAPGLRGRNPWVWLWVPGEGWVKWTDLQRQVERAFERWRAKKAEQGIRIMDFWEARASAIEECVQRKAKAA